MSVEGSISHDQTAPDTAPVTVNDDQELGAVWDRLERDNGSGRDDAGRFSSANGGDEQDPLEGGEGEATAPAETSTPAAVEVPLPSNWNGKEELWQKIPADLREPLRAMQEELHQRQSQMGRELSAYRPIGEVIQRYSDYFGGERGNYKPHEAVDYLFGLQRSMDDNPVETLLQIADTYNLRPALAQMFGGGSEGQGGGNEVQLQARIDQLENQIRNMADPSKIDQRVEQKFEEKRVFSQAEAAMSRVVEAMPLIKEVPDEDLVYFIQKARAKLGETANYEAVLKSAGEMAINADPDLRARAAAVTPAAAQDPSRVAAAKRANSTNIRSTSTGQGRQLTEDEELAKVWEKNQRA